MAKECASCNQIKLSSDSDYFIYENVFINVFLIKFWFLDNLRWIENFETPTFIYWNVNLFDEQNLHNQFLKIVFKTWIIFARHILILNEYFIKYSWNLTIYLSFFRRGPNNTSNGNWIRLLKLMQTD